MHDRGKMPHLSQFNFADNLAADSLRCQVKPYLLYYRCLGSNPHHPALC